MAARRVLLASLLYLPAVLTLLALDKAMNAGTDRSARGRRTGVVARILLTIMGVLAMAGLLVGIRW